MQDTSTSLLVLITIFMLVVAPIAASITMFRWSKKKHLNKVSRIREAIAEKEGHPLPAATKPTPRGYWVISVVLALLVIGHAYSFLRLQGGTTPFETQSWLNLVMPSLMTTVQLVAALSLFVQPRMGALLLAFLAVFSLYNVITAAQSNLGSMPLIIGGLVIFTLFYALSSFYVHRTTKRDA